MTPATAPALTLNNGVTMPALGLGVFQSPPEETTAAVEAALRDGYRQGRLLNVQGGFLRAESRRRRVLQHPDAERQ